MKQGYNKVDMGQAIELGGGRGPNQITDEQKKEIEKIDRQRGKTNLVVAFAQSAMGALPLHEKKLLPTEIRIVMDNVFALADALLDKSGEEADANPINYAILQNIKNLR